MANQYRSVLASSGPAPTGGDALPAEVLSGKTFTNDNGAQTGTMTNNGAVSQTLSAGQSYTIPEGYHNGSGTVTALASGLIPTAGDYIMRSNYQMSSGNNNSLSLTGAGSNVIVWNVSGSSTFTSSDSNMTLFGSTDGSTWSSELPSSSSADVSSYNYVFGIITGPTNITIS